MSISIVLIVFLQSSLFALFTFYIRNLEERGVSARGIAGLHRLAVIPAAIFLAMTFRFEYWHFMVTHPVLSWCIVGIGISWPVAQYVGYIVTNSSSSLTFTYTLSGLLNIPVLLVIGVFLNHDRPHFLALIALAFLAIAILIKPTQHVENKRNLLEWGALIVIGIILIEIIGHAVDGGLYRNLLLAFPNAVWFGISVYIFVVTFMMNLLYLFLPKTKKENILEKDIIKKYWWTALLIPVTWFVASIPEGYAFANVPIFTIGALGAFTFLLSMGSDLHNKRLVWNFRTTLFFLLVLASIVFSTLSLR